MALHDIGEWNKYTLEQPNIREHLRVSRLYKSTYLCKKMELCQVD